MPLNWCCEEAAAYLAGVNTRRANKRQLEMKYRNSKCLVDCGRNSLRDQFASGCSHHCSDSGRTVGAVGIGEGTRKAAGIVARHGERIVHINKPGLTEEVARPDRRGTTVHPSRAGKINRAAGDIRTRSVNIGEADQSVQCGSYLRQGWTCADIDHAPIEGFSDEGNKSQLLRDIGLERLHECVSGEGNGSIASGRRERSCLRQQCIRTMEVAPK